MLDRKFDSDIEWDYVKMLWENCVPVQLCKFVCLKDNFTQLYQLQIAFQKGNDIVKKFYSTRQDKHRIVTSKSSTARRNLSISLRESIPEIVFAQ